MCGRVRLSSDVSEIKLVFSIPLHRPTPNFAPSWNAAPTDSLPVVCYDAKAGERSLDMLRWGLVPFWAKDIKVGFANINAKAEGIYTKPAFREAFERRRCLVPVDNFYEWKKTATGKQPYAIALADRRLMVLAGLWENWRSPAGEWVRSFAIVTTTPNELCAACPHCSMHRLMVDDLKGVFSNLVATWDQQFPRSDAPLAADREAWELLADRNKLLRRAKPQED